MMFNQRDVITEYQILLFDFKYQNFSFLVFQVYLQINKISQSVSQFNIFENQLFLSFFTEFNIYCSKSGNNVSIYQTQIIFIIVVHLEVLDLYLFIVDYFNLCSSIKPSRS